MCTDPAGADPLAGERGAVYDVTRDDVCVFVCLDPAGADPLAGERGAVAARGGHRRVPALQESLPARQQQEKGTTPPPPAPPLCLPCFSC